MGDQFIIKSKKVSSGVVNGDDIELVIIFECSFASIMLDSFASVAYPNPLTVHVIAVW